MKSLVTPIIATTLFFSSFIAAHDKVSASTKIVSIYSKNNGTSYITFEAGKLPGCYSDRGAYISSGTDINKLYSTVLAAKLADKKVIVFYNYNDVNSSYTGWGLCHIEAISVS